jgi:hypothetical protein
MIGKNGGLTEDEVNTSQLLQSLEKTSCCESLAHTTSEAVKVGRFAELHFVLVIGLYLSQFVPDSWVVNGEPAELGKGAGCLLWLV